MHKVCFVLLDGLRYDTGTERLTSLQERLGTAGGVHLKVRSAEPTLSRPNYATLASGVEAIRHGVWGNAHRGPLAVPTIFDRFLEEGIPVATAAYHWWEELLPGKLGQRFLYSNDDYPDADLFGQAEERIGGQVPGFLLLHPMGIDDAGHRFGGLSAEYGAAVSRVNRLLDSFLERWLTEPDRVAIIGSDHGMDAAGRHDRGGTDVQQVPYWFFGGGLDGGHLPGEWAQTAIAPTILRLLGIGVPGHMDTPPLPVAAW